MTRAIATRRPVLAEDTDALRALLEDAPIEIVAGEDERSWVGLPLLAAGAPLGALRFSFGRPRKITEEERVFLEALAGQCALAVERAAMYEREHTTAETLQRSLLPDQLPLVPGLVMEARYLPVARNMEIGGDWYDAFRLADGRLAIAVGDVMGKGLTAAAGMGRVRNALRALALTDPRPAAVLTGLDRLFSATELEEQVTTVAYLVYDPRTGDGLMGNAGHLPVLRLGLDAAPFLDETEAGTPLGWPSPRQQHPFRLPPGGTAVLYSDGLVENRIRGLDAGLDELVTVAARAHGTVVGHPERLLSYLVDAMLAGHEQDDDVTVLVLHVPARKPDGPTVAGLAGREWRIMMAAGNSMRPVCVASVRTPGCSFPCVVMYKSSLTAAYGGVSREAGRLLLRTARMPALANAAPVSRSVQASGPSREDLILATRTQERRPYRSPVRHAGRASRSCMLLASEGRGDRGGAR